MKTEVDAFISSEQRNAWITDGIVNVYVRKSKRIINSEWLVMFDIANISITEEHQGHGHFKNFIMYIESLNVNVYVESVLNPELRIMLLKHNYTENELGDSLYRLK